MELLQFDNIMAGSIPDLDSTMIPQIDGGAIDHNTGLPIDSYGSVVNQLSYKKHDDEVYLCDESDRFGNYYKKFECLQSATSTQKLLQSPLIVLIASSIIIGSKINMTSARLLILFGIALLSVEISIVMPVFAVSYILTYTMSNANYTLKWLIGFIAVLQLFVYLTGITDIISSSINMVFNFILLVLLVLYVISLYRIPNIMIGGTNSYQSGIDLISCGSTAYDEEEFNNSNNPRDLFTEHDEE